MLTYHACQTANLSKKLVCPLSCRVGLKMTALNCSKTLEAINKLIARWLGTVVWVGLGPIHTTVNPTPNLNLIGESDRPHATNRSTSS